MEEAALPRYRIVATGVKKEKGNPDVIGLQGRLVAQSPAVRATNREASLCVDLSFPFEGVGAVCHFTLTAAQTACYGPLKHNLCAGAVFEIAARPKDRAEPARIAKGPCDSKEPWLAPVVELARCSGDGKQVFGLLNLLAPGSHFRPPPMCRAPWAVLGLTSERDVSTATSLWLHEGETEGEGKEGVQRGGQRLSDQLRRKPLLKKWIAETALMLDTTRNTSGSITASRHPVIKPGPLIVVGTALRLFEASQYAPVPCISVQEGVNGEGVILPQGLDEAALRRRQAWGTRKRPQLQWMLERLDELLPCGEERTVLDVGGGKGDLAVWLGHERPQWHTVAVDVHAPSVAQGRDALRKAGLQERARIEVCDATSLLPPLNSQLDNERAVVTDAGPAGNTSAGPAGGNSAGSALVGSFDAVVGLHCCGGLSETALAIALQHRVPFCICTCCFCSHPKLCRLLPEGGKEWERLWVAAEEELGSQAQAMQGCNTEAPEQDPPVKPVKRAKLNPTKARMELLRACEKEGARATEDADKAAIRASGGLWDGLFGPSQATPQAKAMVAVNTMRLRSFHEKAGQEGVVYSTRIVSFDSSVSTRNLAVVGLPVASGEALS